MKTKELNSQNLGAKEDWAGNNIALECPVCGKVYIVSKQLHGERHCPCCGKSRGMVTGGRESGGTASIIWGDKPAFTLGRKYSREVISSVLGGSEIEYLPTENNRVVCGCFNLKCNPEAPDIVIPGTGPIIEREARLFCAQNCAVPIFIKRRPKKWEYVGNYKAVRFSTDPAEIAAHHKGSITPLRKVTSVIFLQRAAQSN
ncbi:MAG: hypothetical protein ABSC89_07880 [Verrucomicrobiota bacterium]|jgi:hypothetical protein